jgi:hypothetical protein
VTAAILIGLESLVGTSWHFLILSWVTNSKASLSMMCESSGELTTSFTERCRNYSQIHCEWAHKCYGNTSCSGTKTGNHDHREETWNFTKDGDGKHLKAAGMCDAFQL